MSCQKYVNFTPGVKSGNGLRVIVSKIRVIIMSKQAVSDCWAEQLFYT